METWRYENMTKYECLKTTTITQPGNVNITVKRMQEDCYLSYDIAEFAKSLAELSSKPVEVEVTQTVIIEPTTKETTKEILIEVKN